MGLLFFDSIYKEKIWGSETWLVSAHHSGETIIKSGEHKGKRLGEVYENFPLLVKIIEANDDLSIQVHPDDDYAKKHENTRGKTECWYVLEAKEGASLIIGHNAKSKEELIEAVEKILIHEKQVLKSKRQPVVVCCIEGRGTADGEEIKEGDSFIIPEFCEAVLTGDMKILLSYEKRENVKIGIDLGGTNIAIGLVDKQGRIIDKMSLPTRSERGIDAICDDIASMCTQLTKKHNLYMRDIAAVGIGCPGTIDAERGYVIYSNNIRWWCEQRR